MENASKKRQAEPLGQNDRLFQQPILKMVKLTPPNDMQRDHTPKKLVQKTPWHANQQFLTKFIQLKRQFSIGDGHIPGDSLLISSWNVNGLRRILNSNYLIDYFNTHKPDILCLNETKVDQEALEKENLTKWIPKEYTSYFNCSKMKKGYSGVAIITRYKPMSVEFGIGHDKHDSAGRVITIEFENFYLVACYVPFSGIKFEKLPYRIGEWDPFFRDYLVKLKTKKAVILCGDLNVAHQPIDSWEQSGKKIGCSLAERESFGKLIGAGFIDSFRYVYPEAVKFTLWDV